jgi:hypothetical protein
MLDLPILVELLVLARRRSRRSRPEAPLRIARTYLPQNGLIGK